MERLNTIGNLLTGSLPNDPNLKVEASRQQMKPKQIQIVEDSKRVISEFKSKATIDGEELSKLVYGPLYGFMKEANEFLKHDPDFSIARLSDGTKDQQRHLTNKLLFKFFKRFPLSYDRFINDPWYFSGISAVLTGYYESVGTKNAVHNCLYSKSLHILGTQKHRHLIERALALKDLGCFALTELAHGSNVQGCITTATFDEMNSCFIINTPHDKGMKFWIGGAAQSANMCVVAANMTVKGKDYGIHLFVVEIRDNINHDLIPGVIIGDCGLKQGINGVDNGFIYFRAVRVPLDSLLDKVTQVSASGEVHSIIENKTKRFALQLSALSEGRVKIAFTTLTAGLRGAAIVLRYAAVRRQFGKEKYVESSLIDYPGYQQRIFPYIIFTIISCFAGMESNRLWQDNYHQILDQKNKTIEEMHAIISCLKPILTWNLLNGLNEFRTAMGGLGYSKHAVIPQMIDDYHVMVTWEGENHVLIQQTGKFLLKQYFKKLSGDTTNAFLTTDYVTAEALKWNFQLTNMAALGSETVLHSLLVFRAAKALQIAFNHIQSRVAEVGDFDAFNESTVFGLTEASIYYGELYIFRCSINELSKRPNDENKKFMMQLLQLFVIERVLTSGTILMGYITEEEVNFLRKARIELNHTIRFNLLKSLDYLFLEEHVVVSPFGNKDGDMYGRFISKLLGEQGNFGKPAFWREIWELKNSN